MILVWKGLGILVPAIWFVVFFTAMVIGNNSGGVGGEKPNVRLFAAVGSIIGGLAVSITGYFLNRKIESSDNKHSFFFIPNEYCGIVIILITILLAVFVPDNPTYLP